MKKQFSKVILGISTLAISSVGLMSTATADYRSSSYGSNSDYVMADVVRSEPIYKTVTVSRPERVCEEVEVYDEPRYSSRRDRRRRGSDSTAGGTIAGGIIGGVIGRQIGGGSGRDAATIAGVLIGSAIGNDNAARNNEYRRRAEERDRRGEYDDYRVRTEQRCHTRTERSTEERLDGYNVTYFLNGQEYQTRTRNKPGSQIRVRVTVTPVNEGSYRDYDDDLYEGRYETNYEDSRYEDYDY